MIELGAGFVLVSIVVFLFFDVCLLVMGAIINDAIAADAARAASMGQPGKLAVGRERVVKENQSPYIRALAVVENKNSTLFPSIFDLDPTINIIETISPPIPTPPLGGTVYGSVSVATVIWIHPKFMIGFLKPGPISLTASKTCPYTWVMKGEVEL